MNYFFSGCGGAARVSGISFTKSLQSEFFFIKNSNLTKKKFWLLEEEGVGMWQGEVIFFSKESKSEFFFFSEAVKVIRTIPWMH